MTIKIKGLAVVESNKSNFDFDYWHDLAKKDPDAFEAAREKAIDQHITEITDENAQERLRRLQWRVEMERKLSKNPMDSAVRIYGMMWDSVAKNFDALQDLTSQLTPKNEKQTKKISQAKILKFKQEEADATVG